MIKHSQVADWPRDQYGKAQISHTNPDVPCIRIQDGIPGGSKLGPQDSDLVSVELTKDLKGQQMRTSRVSLTIARAQKRD